MKGFQLSDPTLLVRHVYEWRGEGQHGARVMLELDGAAIDTLFTDDDADLDDLREGLLTVIRDSFLAFRAMQADPKSAILRG